jgi:septal ring factor EnvC (AmiA/AmiB activator)
VEKFIEKETKYSPRENIYKKETKNKKNKYRKNKIKKEKEAGNKKKQEKEIKKEIRKIEKEKINQKERKKETEKEKNPRPPTHAASATHCQIVTEATHMILPNFTIDSSGGIMTGTGGMAQTSYYIG